MKLLSKPETVIQNVQINLSGLPTYIPGRPDIVNVKIAVPDKPLNSKDKVWQKLKYGKVIEFELGQKIDRLEFNEEKEDIILYGVLPIEMESTAIWEGRVFECHIDHYERIPTC